jgi:hypothetical protein
MLKGERRIEYRASSRQAMRRAEPEEEDEDMPGTIWQGALESPATPT